jgi:hypothetical protein
VSLYKREPGVSPIKIGVYQKKHRFSAVPSIDPTREQKRDSTDADATYQSFFLSEGTHEIAHGHQRSG